LRDLRNGIQNSALAALIVVLRGRLIVIVLPKDAKAGSRRIAPEIVHIRHGRYRSGRTEVPLVERPRRNEMMVMMVMKALTATPTSKFCHVPAGLLISRLRLMVVVYG